MSRQDSAKPSLWQTVDEKIFRVERIMVVACCLAMVGAVFLSVAWEIFAAPENIWQRKLGPVFNDAPWLGLGGDFLSLVVWVGLCIAGAKTAAKDSGWRPALLKGLGVAGATILSGWALVWLMPTGINFSQRLALCLLMWVVMLGSSMAAYQRRHIALQAAQKLVPQARLREHATLSLALAAAFTSFLAWVGAVYTVDKFSFWYDSGFLAGTMDSVPIPVWTVTLAIPLGFGLTAARFIAQSFAIWQGKLPPIPINEEIEAAAKAADGPGVEGELA